MYRLLIALLAFITVNPTMQASKEVGCVCMNRTIRNPSCGICGSTSGMMEQNDTGADCICKGQKISFKSHEATCAEACQKDGGWTGQFEE